jgi:putative transposase
MVRGFKYRCYPTKAQEQQLAKTFGAVRFVYNWALEQRTKAWYEKQERISYNKTSAMLTELKQQPDTAWLYDAVSVPQQQALRHLQTAFVNFWEKRAKYPSFKKKHGRQSAEFTSSAFQWDEHDLRIAKIGKLKIKWSRRFKGRPTNVTVSKARSGRYYVSFTVDDPLPKQPKTRKSVGIDLGLTSFVTLSTGEKIQAPKPLKANLAKLKRRQQSLSRKMLGSNNRAKARIAVAKIYEKVAFIRLDFLHKLSTRLIRENQTIVIEDLNIRGMSKNHCLARSISDVSWAEFTRQLAYKCAWYGRTLVKIDRFYPSTKRCYDCGYVLDKLPLDQRSWTCPSCHIIHDRDNNAAKNILAAGQAVIACGDGVRPAKNPLGSRLAAICEAGT